MIPTRAALAQRETRAGERNVGCNYQIVVLRALANWHELLADLMQGGDFTA